MISGYRLPHHYIGSDAATLSPDTVWLYLLNHCVLNLQGFQTDGPPTWRSSMVFKMIKYLDMSIAFYHIYLYN